MNAAISPPVSFVNQLRINSLSSSLRIQTLFLTKKKKRKEKKKELALCCSNLTRFLNNINLKANIKEVMIKKCAD